MKRQKRKTKAGAKSHTAQSAPPPPPPPPAPKRLNRRDFLSNLAVYGIGATIAVGGGVYFTRHFQAVARESDLSTIGNGVPAVVQVHDPSCPTCTALQREAREAASGLGDGRLQFLVASLQTEDGRELAAAHGVGKITLLLFDGKGQRQGVLHGLNSAETLRPIFANHAKRYGAGS